MRGLRKKLSGIVSGLSGIRVRGRECYGIVFYSEGGHYWSTFEPVVRALDEQGVACTYLTSGEDDPGLAYESPNVHPEYIGKGFWAHTTLNLLEADVCVLTTPGLDVLQIRRTRGVGHYVHLMHSIADIRSFKQFSFDHFDTILTAGEHQIAGLKELERRRGTRPKNLLRTGCAYMDLLAARVADEGATVDGQGTSVLVAPTWGANGLLARFGAEVPKALLDAGFHVIVRPHPQSHVSEEGMLDSLTDELAGYPSLGWDDAADPFASLQKADLLVSDVSAIVFDAAFVFGKPVITVRFPYGETGMEASDLPGELWEMTALERVGAQVGETEIAALPEKVRSMLGNEGLRQGIRDLMAATLFNPGQVGMTAARQILEIQRGLGEAAA